MTNTCLEMKARPSACKVSAPCPLLKLCGKSVQLINTHTDITFEIKQTRDSFGKWLVKLKFHSYIALVGEGNVTFGGGSSCVRSNSSMKYPAIKCGVLIPAQRSSDVCLIPQIEYYRPRPRFSRDSCLETNLRWVSAYR